MASKINHGVVLSLFLSGHLTSMPFSEKKHKSFNSTIEDFLKIFDRKTPDQRFNEEKFDQKKLKEFIKSFLNELDHDADLIFKISFHRTVNFMKAILRASMEDEMMSMLIDPEKIDYRIQQLTKLAETMGETLSINFLYNKEYTPLQEVDLKKFIQKINSCLTLCHIIETIMNWHEKEYGIMKQSLEHRTQIIVAQSRPLVVTKILIKKIKFHQTGLYRSLNEQTRDPASDLYLQGGKYSAVGRIIQEIEEENWSDIAI